MAEPTTESVAEPKHASSKLLESQRLRRLEQALQVDTRARLDEGQVRDLVQQSGLDTDTLEAAFQAMDVPGAEGFRQTRVRTHPAILWGAALLPLFWGALAYLFRHNQEALVFLTCVAPAPLVLFVGVVLGRARAAAAVAMALVIALIPGFWALLQMTNPSMWVAESPVPTLRSIPTADGTFLIKNDATMMENIWFSVIYAAIGLGVAAGLGTLGSRMRTILFGDDQAHRSVSREDLLHLVFKLQEELDSQRRHAAFVSVDVVGSTQMKRCGSEIEVELAFGEYRKYVEGLAEKYGGIVQSTAGDGIMCMFPDDLAALRMAREVQLGMPQFNESKNKLRMPFQVRCGISSGEIAVQSNQPIGHLQSVVIDRAAILQKRARPGGIALGAEVSEKAKTELGPLGRLEESDETLRAFIWPRTEM